MVAKIYHVKALILLRRLDGLRILTLNDVITLSQKGDALSWDDFDPFAYVEVGFGFYIRNYPINDYYALL